MRKLFPKWVPRLLTSDQKQQRVEELERCLELFKRVKKDFLRRYVTMNKTWIHHYRPETKRSLDHMQKKKVLFHQGNAPCQRSTETMVKLNELSFELLPHPSYSPDLALSDYWLFADMKKMLPRKRLCSNEEVIAETEAYFERKAESFYNKGIEKLKKR